MEYVLHHHFWFSWNLPWFLDLRNICIFSVELQAVSFIWTAKYQFNFFFFKWWTLYIKGTQFTCGSFWSLCEYFLSNTSLRFHFGLVSAFIAKLYFVFFVQIVCFVCKAKKTIEACNRLALKIHILKFISKWISKYINVVHLNLWTTDF